MLQSDRLRLANIRLSWKGLPGTNALAYYEKVQLMAVKSFITLETVCGTQFGLLFVLANLLHFHLNKQFHNMVCCRYFKVSKVV